MRHRPAYRPRLEILESRSLPSIVPTAELTEGNASQWTTFASDNATASVSDDASKVAVGGRSLRFDTQSGFDTGVRIAPSGDTWDLRSFEQLAFWTFAVNDTPVGFQGDQPVVVIRSAAGSYTFTPSSQQMLNRGWKKHHVPLDGDANWTRSVGGSPDLANVTALEIHQDTWDFGFTVYYDGVQFSTRGVNAATGPTPPPGVVPGLVAPKMLLYVFDPIMENHGGRRLHDVYGWADPVTLTQNALADFATSSHGKYRPQIVETVIADAQPYFEDGFRHTDASFDVAWANRDFHQGFEFDYERFINENNLADRVDAGEIDEVWIYSPPIGGMYESVMAGDGAYWINGPPQPAGDRVFPIMGLNYERGVGEAIHSFGHRAENTMAHAYQTISGDANNAWRHFSRFDRDNPGQSSVGNVHFPPNATGDYDYGDNDPAADLPVSSDADDWYNYPNLTGARRSFNSREWSPSHADTQREYLNWWYDHMPHFQGRGPDDRLANWWRYLGDLDAFKDASRTLYGTDGTGRAWLNGIAAGQTVSGTRTITGDTLLDGVAGRMDLYIDGVYHSSDTLAPFTFAWNTAGLSAGSHTVQVRAYEAQVGTETRSNIVTVQSAGVYRVKDVVPGSASSNPTNLTRVGNLLFYTAWTEAGGTELYRSDGTAAGTYRVKDIVAGSGSSSPRNLTAVGDLLYFTATHPTTGSELYRSDGTSSGTYLVRDVYPGAGSGMPGKVVAVGSTLYFAVNHPQYGVELWKSNGTASGTVLVRDIRPGTSSGSPMGLAALGTKLLFTATQPDTGRELWKSDGTSSGTSRLRDIRTGANSSDIGAIVAAGGKSYFRAFTDATGFELWRTDGTTAGTALVRDINAGPASSPNRLTVVGSRLFFTATQATTGEELWRTEGTTVMLIRNIGSGSAGSNPTNLVAVGSVLYFAATGAGTGTELWRSDGTNAGTTLVRDIVVGATSSAPRSFVSHGGWLYFAARTPTNGLELWRSNGTAGGTTRLSDINAGAGDSTPSLLVSVNGLLFFTAIEGTAGRELWAYRS